MLGLTVAGALWWAYFDVVAIVAERALRRAEGEERARLARDAYSYLHLPMIAGDRAAGAGAEEGAGVRGGSTSHHSCPTRWHALPLGALYGGVALYLLAHVGVQVPDLAPRVRAAGGGRRRCCSGLSRSPPMIPALAALGLLRPCMVGVIAFESIQYSEVRERVRHEDDPREDDPMEAVEEHTD